MKNIFVILSIFLTSFISNYAIADTDPFSVDIKTFLNDLRKEFINLRNSKESDELPMYIDKVSIELNNIAKYD